MSTITSPTTHGPTVAPILLTVCEAADLLSVSRSTTYRLIGDGELEVVRIGRATRVPLTSVTDLVDRLRSHANDDNAPATG